MEGIDIKHILLAFFHFSLNPVPVEVSENMIVVASRCCESLPLPDIIVKKTFLAQSGCVVQNTSQMLLQILGKVLIKLFAQKMC